MSLPLIAVTAAAGKTGSAAVRELRARGLAVRALARRRDVRGEALARMDAEIVETDLFHSQRMADALRGGAAFRRALSEFMLAPLRRGYDPAAYERRLNLPSPAHPLYAMQDEAWKADHAPLGDVESAPPDATPHIAETRRIPA